MSVMANSKAKKRRLKELRERGKDVTIQRRQADFSTHVRMTKTKQDALKKLDKKHKRHFQVNYTDSSGNAFYVLDCTSIALNRSLFHNRRPNSTGATRNRNIWRIINTVIHI